MVNEAEDCDIVGSSEPSPGLAVDRMVSSGMKNVGARIFCQGTGSTGLDGFCYRRVFRGDEVVDCFLFREQKLTAGEMPRRKAVGERGRRFEEEHRAGPARNGSQLKYYKAQAALRNTAVFSQGKRGEKRDRAQSNGSASSGGSPEQPKWKCNKTEQGRWMFRRAVHKTSVETLNMWLEFFLKSSLG